MKRHPALVPLSHDHHHALAEARRLRQAAAEGDAHVRAAAARRFVAFFRRETAAHFREEEERLFPLAPGGAQPPQLAQALLDHVELRRLVARLEGEADAPDVDLLATLARRLEEHVRLEERELFPLLEQAAAPEALAALGLAPRGDAEPGPPVVALSACAGARGPLWGADTEDLNATLLAWPPGEGPPEHVNAERDVVVVVLEGGGTVTVDGVERPIAAGDAAVFEKGCRRRIVAGPQGLRYLTVHRRRVGVRIAPAPRR